MPLHLQFGACPRRRERGDLRRCVVNPERTALHARGQRLCRWIARSVRCRYPYAVLAVRIGRRIPGKVPLRHLVLEQLPFLLARAANLHCEHQRIAVGVRCRPACADEPLRVLHRRSAVHRRSGPTAGARPLAHRRQRQRGLKYDHRCRSRGEPVVWRRGFDLVDTRLQVLGQICYVHRIEVGRSARQRRFPLYETGRRRSHASALGATGHSGPRAPVVLRPVQIAAARRHRYLSTVQAGLKAEPAPQRIHAGIEHIAFDRAFVFQPGPISYTFPVFPVAAYRRPSRPAWNAVTWVAGSDSSEVYIVGDSMR